MGADKGRMGSNYAKRQQMKTKLPMRWNKRVSGHDWETVGVEVIGVEVIEVKWKDVVPGDIVFIAGNLVDGVPTALYGRHKVVDPDKHILENRHGKQFYENWDSVFMEAK